MSGFEWEFLRRKRGESVAQQTHREWFAGLPNWLKFAFIFLAIPAWLVIGFNVLTGNSDAASAYIAFGVFAAVTLAAIAHESRNKNG